MLLLLAPQADADAALAYMRAHLAADQALVAGRLDDARTGFEHCRELAPESSTIAYALACVAARSGDVERALTTLEDARRLGFREVALAEWDADLATLRGEPRFQTVMSSIRGAWDFRLACEFRPILPQGTTTKPRESAVAYAETSAPGECIVVGFSSGALQRLDLRTGALECTYQSLHGAVQVIAMHPLRAEFAVLTAAGELVVYDCDATAPFARLPHRLASKDGEAVQPLDAWLEYDASGDFVAVQTETRRSLIWRVGAGRAVELPAAASSSRRQRSAWTSDGRSLARTEGHEIRFYARDDGADRGAFTMDSPALCIAFDSVGRRFATGHDDGTVRLWDARTFQQLRSIEVPCGMWGDRQYVKALTFSLDDGRLVFAVSNALAVGALGAENGESVFFSGMPWHDARETAGLLVDQRGTRVWVSPDAGGTLQRASARYPEVIKPLVGRAPRANSSGIAAIANWRGVAGFDFERERELWFRPALAGEDFVQSSSGYFGSIPNRLEQLEVVLEQGPHEPRAPLWTRVHELFDPKRVRASLAGVELVLWR